MLRALPPGHPLETVLRQSPDFSRRPPSRMLFCTHRTVRILCRKCSILSSEHG